MSDGKLCKECLGFAELAGCTVANLRQAGDAPGPNQPVYLIRTNIDITTDKLKLLFDPIFAKDIIDAINQISSLDCHRIYNLIMSVLNNSYEQGQVFTVFLEDNEECSYTKKNISAMEGICELFATWFPDGRVNLNAINSPDYTDLVQAIIDKMLILRTQLKNLRYIDEHVELLRQSIGRDSQNTESDAVNLFADILRSTLPARCGYLPSKDAPMYMRALFVLFKPLNNSTILHIIELISQDAQCGDWLYLIVNNLKEIWTCIENNDYVYMSRYLLPPKLATAVMNEVSKSRSGIRAPIVNALSNAYQLAGWLQ